MQRFLLVLAVLALGGLLLRVVAVGNNVTAANDAVSLITVLRPPAGFVATTGESGCPQFEFCFRTSGLLQPMSRENAKTLMTQFGLAVSDIGCASGKDELTCTGSGTMMGVNRLTTVYFSAQSGPQINVGDSSSPQFAPGTYAAFGTKALKRLPLTARFQ